MTDEQGSGIDWKSRGRLIAIGLIGCAVAAAIFFYGMTWLAKHRAPAWQVVGATLLYSGVILGIVTTVNGRAAKLTDIRRSPALKRYSKRIMAITFVYMLLVLGAVFTFIYLRPKGPLAFGVALAPAMGAIGFFVAVGLYLREETDEFWRRLWVESILLAMGGTLVLATIWGFLEMFRQVPHLPMWVVAPAFGFLTIPSLLIVNRRYQ